MGDAKYLNKMHAPKTLSVVKGCPVMLLKNLSNTLVNGLIGSVKSFDENNITVHFQN